MEILYVLLESNHGFKGIIKAIPVSCHGTASLCMIEESELVSSISYRDFDTSNFT